MASIPLRITRVLKNIFRCRDCPCVGVPCDFWAEAHRGYLNSYNNFSSIHSMTYGQISILNAAGTLGIAINYCLQGHYKNLRVLEIGSGWGGLTYYFASILKEFSLDNRLMCLDSFDSNLPPDTGVMCPVNQAQHVKNIAAFGHVSDVVKIFDCDIDTALEAFRDHYFDVVGINVPARLHKNLLFQVSRIIKVGGLVLGHTRDETREKWVNEL